MNPDRAQRRLAAILAADVVGYSRLIEADEDGTWDRLKAIRAEVIDPKLAEHRGRLVKTTGDGLLVEFGSVVDALRCASDIQGSMAERNGEALADRRIEFRIGIHQGDVVAEDGDIFGDGVNIAARLEGLAEPGGICVSARVQEDAAGKLDLVFADIGDQALKNITRPVHVYRVATAAAARSTRPIVVLRAANMSGDSQQEYFADGRGARAELDRGRDFYRRRAWADAYRSFSLADHAAPLGAEDIELLATSAYLVGHDDEYLRMLERAYYAHLSARQTLRAVRCAFWLGLHLVLHGETGPGTGWLARAQRLLAGEGRSAVEAGYLLLPGVLQRIDAADWEAALTMATEAAEIGSRFEDADLIAAARHLHGRVLLLQGQVEKGLALLDEVMVAVSAGELSPIVTGLIYCSVIAGCQQVYALGRAQEWTAALHAWCAAQPELVFAGQCLVHRAEIMQLHGAWPDAIEEARRAQERLFHRADRQAAGAAFYQEAEVYRLRGEFAAADEAYRSASEWGWEPQPGLALLRLAQGCTDAALGTIRRVVGAARDPLQRTRLLPAYIEILLAAGESEAARVACCELEAISEAFGGGVLGAIAAHARGAIALAEDDARAALDPLGRSLEAWQKVEAPYLAARVRVRIGLACRALGDHDGAGLELAAARAVFERLGAAPDLARITRLTKDRSSARPYGLTRREGEVLRLVAAGMTNKAIAGKLFLSEKTVDRHVSNIFNKLNVPTRAAATAYAYEHKLI